MTRDGYRYVAELARENGEAVGQYPLAVDWEPALEWARFTAWRQGHAAAYPLGLVQTIDPVWETAAGAPYIQGVRLTMAGNGAGGISVDIPAAYFHPLARAIATRLVTANVLQEGELFRTRVTAYAQGVKGAAPSARGGVEFEEVALPVPCRPARLAEFTERSTVYGELGTEDVPVFVPQDVLAETTELTIRARDRETGGVLIGELCQDGHELFVEITAQIPVQHAVSEKMKLTITPATWTATQQAIDLRGRGEAWLGWWHSHPQKFWCRPECSPEARKHCPYKRNFFSADDMALHRTVFGRAYHTALVVTHTDDGIQYAMFGWRQGMIVARGFHVLSARPNPATAASARSPAKGAASHETAHTH